MELVHQLVAFLFKCLILYFFAVKVIPANQKSIAMQPEVPMISQENFEVKTNMWLHGLIETVETNVQRDEDEIHEKNYMLIQQENFDVFQTTLWLNRLIETVVDKFEKNDPIQEPIRLEDPIDVTDMNNLIETVKETGEQQKSAFEKLDEDVQDEPIEEKISETNKMLNVLNEKIEMNTMSGKETVKAVGDFIEKRDEIEKKVFAAMEKDKIKLQAISGKTIDAPKLPTVINQQVEAEKDIMKNYCQIRNKQIKMEPIKKEQIKKEDICEQEYKVLSWLKETFDVRITNNGGTNQGLGPAFNFANPPKVKNELTLTNLQGVAKTLQGVEDKPYTFEEFTYELSQEKQDKIKKEIQQRLADVHGVKFDEIQNLKFSKGSVKVTYDTPMKAANLDYKDLDKEFQEKFDAFEKMKIHSAFFKPEFDISMFDPLGHKDFRYQRGKSFPGIGGLTYHQPEGWIRMGLKVTDQYDNGDNSWLLPFPTDKIDNPNIWARGYHGTGSSTETDGIELASVIYKSGGLRPGNHNTYGKGVYWSDNPNFRNGVYDAIAESHGRKYKVKLQVAIKPHTWTQNTKDNYHVTDEKNIRVYGILITDVGDVSTSKHSRKQYGSKSPDSKSPDSKSPDSKLLDSKSTDLFHSRAYKNPDSSHNQDEFSDPSISRCYNPKKNPFQ